MCRTFMNVIAIKMHLKININIYPPPTALHTLRKEGQPAAEGRAWGIGRWIARELAATRKMGSNRRSCRRMRGHQSTEVASGQTTTYEYTRARLSSEVNHGRARSVLGCGTAVGFTSWPPTALRVKIPTMDLFPASVSACFGERGKKNKFSLC